MVLNFIPYLWSWNRARGQIGKLYQKGDEKMCWQITQCCSHPSIHTGYLSSVLQRLPSSLVLSTKEDIVPLCRPHPYSPLDQSHLGSPMMKLCAQLA